MKKLLAIVAVLLMAAPAVANDNLLSQLGLSGIQVVTADEASQVSGRGFVAAYGTSSVEGGGSGSVTGADFSSAQELTLEGIQALMGAVSSAGQISIDNSTDVDGSYDMQNGILSVGAGSTAVGSAD